VLRRAELQARPIAGPAIIQEYDTHIVVPPGSSARLDDHHNVLIDLGPTSARS
jgi:N-methylhydantoinase A